MSHQLSWIKGDPPTYMWCLAVYLSNDDPPVERVDKLWFNPHAVHNWWKGSAENMTTFMQPVTHWMPMPLPPQAKGQAA